MERRNFLKGTLLTTGSLLLGNAFTYRLLEKEPKEYPLPPAIEKIQEGNGKNVLVLMSAGTRLGNTDRLGGRLSNVPEHIVSRLKPRRPDNSVASWAFRFAGSPAKVLTVLSGMTYMEHLQDNIRTFSPLDPLTEEEEKFLAQTADLMMQYPTIPCNDCKYCMPCPYGIDIPAVLLHYNKCVNEGNLPASSQEEHYRQACRAFLIGYDRSVPRLRQANHCIGCGQCVHHCPQSINIPKELQRIDTFAEYLKQGILG